MGLADRQERGSRGSTEAEDWYEEGVNFACTGCGACCTGQSGYVWVDLAEVRELSAALGLSIDEFGRRFLRGIGNRYALLEDALTGACVFLRGKACSVYEQRPRQCRSYPFWSRVMASPENWRAEAAVCEGIDPGAARVDAQTIRRRLDAAKSRA